MAMGAIEFLIAAGLAAGGLLAAAGYGGIGVNPADFRKSRFCFSFAAICFGGTIIMWGITSVQPLWARVFIVAAFGAIIAVAFVEIWRWVDKREGKTEEQHTVAATKTPTYLRLQFNSPGSTVEIGKSNIWYWYTLTFIKQAHFNKKKEMTQSVPGHLVFIVFDKPISLKQPLIETAGGAMPLYEEKSRSDRHLIFEFDGDISGKVITIRAALND
jgi:hypothetical protein